MGTRMVPVYFDDYTGKETDTIHTVQFAYGGVVYQIDLATDTCAEFERVIRPYCDASRKVGKLAGNGKVTTQPGSIPRGPDHPAVQRGFFKQERQAVRDWWRQNWQAAGLPEAAEIQRGQIPKSVMDAYHASGGRPIPAPEPPADKPRRARRPEPAGT